MRGTSPAGWLFNWSTRGVFIISLCLSLVFITSCGGVSEEDLNNLKLENQALEAELEQERRQSEILNRALTNAYKERDRLVDMLNGPADEEVVSGDTAEAQTAQTTSGTQTETSNTYIVKSGDTLSSIAQRHNTSMSVLLSLNPYLVRRNDYMVWENDKIILPR